MCRETQHADFLFFLLSRDPAAGLFDKLLDRPVQAFDGFFVPLFDGIHQAMFNVVLQDYFTGAVDSGPHGGKLDQHIRTVLPVFHHPFDRFQMSDGTGKAIEDRLGLGVLMVMRRKGLCGGSLRMGLCVTGHKGSSPVR